MNQFFKCLKHWNIATLIENCKLKIENSRAGFTMFELMVAIGIFALLTGVVLANFRSGERSETLRLATEQLAGDLRRVQGMVATGQTSVYKDSDDAAPRQQFPRNGYALALQTGSDAGVYRLLIIDRADAPATPPIASVTLPRDIVVTAIALDDTPANALTIIIRPPSATIVFQTVAGGFFSNAERATVTLRHSVTQEQRTIIVDRRSGRIDIE